MQFTVLCVLQHRSKFRRPLYKRRAQQMMMGAEDDGEGKLISLSFCHFTISCCTLSLVSSLSWRVDFAVSDAAADCFSIDSPIEERSSRSSRTCVSTLLFTPVYAFYLPLLLSSWRHSHSFPLFCSFPSQYRSFQHRFILVKGTKVADIKLGRENEKEGGKTQTYVANNELQSCTDREKEHMPECAPQYAKKYNTTAISLVCVCAFPCLLFTTSTNGNHHTTTTSTTSTTRTTLLVQFKVQLDRCAQSAEGRCSLFSGVQWQRVREGERVGT